MYFWLEHPDRADRAVQWGRGDEDAARRAGRAGSDVRAACRSSNAAGAVFAAGLGPTPTVSVTATI